eukprot:1161504-Pelagomonas_calceolata.AAC.1
MMTAPGVCCQSSTSAYNIDSSTHLFVYSITYLQSVERLVVQEVEAMAICGAPHDDRSICPHMYRLWCAWVCLQEGGAMALCGAPHDDRSRRMLLELQGRAEVVAAVQVRAEVVHRPWICLSVRRLSTLHTCAH